MSKSTANQPTEKKAVGIIGNKTTEVIIGAAANKFMSATTSFESMMDSYNKMKEEFDETISEKTLQVVTLESQIEGLKQDLENKTTQNKIELTNEFNADKKAFVDAWLKENGYTMIFVNELVALRKELTETKANVEAQIKTAVTANTELLQNSHNNTISTLRLTHEKNESDNLNQVKSLNEKIIFLNQQITMWQDALTAEREAGVKRAQASQIQNLNVGDGRK